MIVYYCTNFLKFSIFIFKIQNYELQIDTGSHSAFGTV